MIRNVLVISPVPTHPPTSGNRSRVHELTRALVELGHRVHFMHVLQDPGDEAAMRRHWGEQYVSVPYRRNTSPLRRRWRRVARAAGLYGAYTYGIDEWYPPALDREVDALLSRVPIDTVLVEYVFLSRALLQCPAGTRRIIDTNDEFANRHRRYLSAGQQPAWYSCTPRAERKGLSRADVVLAIQQHEAERFRSVTRARVEVVGHLAPLRLLPPTDIVPGRILAVGSDNPINVSALAWFLERVLPRIRQSVPDCELAVAGSLCRSLTASPGVRLLGELEELANAYASAQVVVNPMQFGTGLKIKSLEALCYGRALVTTSVGAAGLDDRRDAFREADTADGFAAAVVDLLQGRAGAVALGEAGFRFAGEYMDGVRRALAAVFGSGAREERNGTSAGERPTLRSGGGSA